MNVGQAVFIRTVTYHYTGRVAEVSKNEVRLDEAAWIADSGRFTNFLNSGALAECEIYPDGVTVNRRSIVDWCPWPHPLPREQK